MRLCMAVLLAAAAIACRAEEFFLKGDDGTSYGPFELKEGAKVRIGQAEATLSRIQTKESQVREALDRIIIPEVEFRDADIRDVITFLQEASVEHDAKKRGVNMILSLTSATNAVPDSTTALSTNAPQREECQRITFKARDISLLETLKIVTNIAGMKYVIEDNAVLVLPQSSPTGPLVRRMFDILPSFWEKIREMNEANAAHENRDINDTLRMFFRDFGVQWPAGSSIKFALTVGKIIVVNTKENIEVLEALFSRLDVIPYEIEIQLEFVSFDLTNIERLASSSISAKELTRLWTNGHGQLLASPRVITQPGVQATVKGVTECIYPTEYRAYHNASTNEPCTHSETNSVLSEPGDYETREVGAILTVLPEVSPEGQIINLTLTPELVEEPTWRHFNGTCEDSKGELRTIPQEQPFFHIYSFNTSISISNGARVLVGGGMPNRDGSKVVYAFVTARLVGMDGEPLKTYDPNETF